MPIEQLRVMKLADPSLTDVVRLAASGGGADWAASRAPKHGEAARTTRNGSGSRTSRSARPAEVRSAYAKSRLAFV